MQTPQEFDVDAAMATLSSPIFDEEEREKHEESTKIEIYRLNDCCINQVDLMMYYGSNFELASAEESALKDTVARAYAVLDPQARAMLQSNGGKVTEATVDATIKAHNEYTDLQAKYLAAKKNTGMWKAARDSVIHRKDMLVQLASNYRAENTGEVSIKTNAETVRNLLKTRKNNNKE